MKTYIYQNNLIGKKQLRQILSWSFSTYDSMQACTLADELKYVGFKYATRAGISISIEDLRIPFIKTLMLEKANQDIIDSEKIYLKGKITDVERFQKIIDTWNLTSESLKDQVIGYFKNYDPLNSVYIMAFSGARGNLSQVRQLVGMRGLMSDPSGEIMNLPIKKNFREGLTITDYLMSGYGARKGIVDTALKTANSGYLTRRLIDVAQDILIRERDCLTKHTFLINNFEGMGKELIGRVLSKAIFDPNSLKSIAFKNTQITSVLLGIFVQKSISQIYIRSPLTCKLYRAICQHCYGWDLATENLIDIGDAIGILAGQSIGEPGTQLTMRTFHTGGIFTSELRQQIIAKTSGLIKFSKFLKTVVLRTNRGEDVLVTKNSGSLILIPQFKTEKPFKIDILRNTILFPKHNQYIQKATVLGELININTQLKREIKPVLATTSGEIIVPILKTPINNLNRNRLIWLLSGQLYNSPLNSYINLYSDHKLNKNSFIFRTKIVSDYSGKLNYLNKSYTLYKRNILIKNKLGFIKNVNFFKLSTRLGNAQALLKFKNLWYLTYTRLKDNKIYLKITSKDQFAHLLSNVYKTKTGGILHYDCRNIKCLNNNRLKIDFFKKPKKIPLSKKHKKLIKLFKECETLIKLFKRCEKLKKSDSLKNCKKFKKNELSNGSKKLNILLKKCKTLKKSELSKKCKTLKKREISKKAKELKELLKICKPLKKSELLKESKKLKKLLLKEVLKKYKKANRFSKIIYRTLIWLEEETYSVNYEPNVLLANHGDFIAKNFEITPGCFSKTSGLVLLEQKNNIVKTITIQSGLIYQGNHFTKQTKKVYFSGEKIFSDIAIFSPSFCRRITRKNQGQLLVCPIQLYEFPYKKTFNNILPPINSLENFLEFKNDSHVMYQSNQKVKFKRSVTLILDSIFFKTSKSVRNNSCIELNTNQDQNSLSFKVRHQINLNNYILPKLKYKNVQSCSLIQKNQFIDRYTTFIYLESVTLNSLEIVKIKINQSSIKQILLISNDNCSIVKKQILPDNRLNDFILNSNDINHVGKIIIDNNKFFTIQKGRPYFFPNCKVSNSVGHTNLKYKFVSNKRNQNLLINNKKIFLNQYSRLKVCVEKDLKNYSKGINICKSHFSRTHLPLKVKLATMFLKKNGKLYSCLIPRFLDQFNIGFKTNIESFSYKKFFTYKTKEDSKINCTLLMQSSEIVSNRLNVPKLTLVKFLEYPLAKVTKSIGIYSITEDFFEEESNSVFCQNHQFLENGDTIGLLNLEKEITGDIVQGLPRIEEILEARKKKQIIKRIPASQKKGLLAQNSSLDQNFEFRKLGSPINENEKINPHKLLKVYFNYYGLLQPFFCDQENLIKYARLINNFEGSYKSFKKVQSFILNSVQNVYKSQGVDINDKHLEVIVKQMTTKVLITEEGDTPLLKREIIDLYHIEYINKIIKKEKKIGAYYLPLLFGITRAALNNPSFISAASFQETTRVLTKAAIEGRIDWLRGLKENIIIGHLIPAGTGSRSYKKSFKKITSIPNKQIKVTSGILL